MTAVLLDRQQPLDAAAVGPLLETHAGLHRVDARRAARRQRGILATGLADGDAAALVDAFARFDPPIGARAVPDASIAEVPPARTGAYLDGYAEGILIGKLSREPLPWSSVAWIHVALQATTGGVTAEDRQAFSPASEAGLSTAGLTLEEARAIRNVSKQRQDAPSDALANLATWLTYVAREELAMADQGRWPELFLDVRLREPDQLFRFVGRQLMADPLGTERSPNWLRNAWLLTRRLVEFLPPERVAVSAQQFLAASDTTAPRWALMIDSPFELAPSLRWLDTVHGAGDLQGELADSGDEHGREAAAGRPVGEEAEEGQRDQPPLPGKAPAGPVA